MSFSTTLVAEAKEDLIIDIPAKGDSVGANATPEVDLAGSGDAPHILYGINVDCSDNPNEDVTLRLYNTAGTPTVGTGLAHVWMKCKRGVAKNDMEWLMGVRFSTGIAAAVVQGLGGTAGADNPSGTVRVTLRVKR